MKKFYIWMLTCILGIGVLQAQQNYSVRTSDFTSIQMTLTAPVPTVGTTNYLDVEYDVLQMPGFAETHTIGEPSLPQFGHMVEIPLCDGITVKAENAVYETIDGATIGLTHKIMPTQLPRSKSDNSPLTLTMNNATYTTDDLYSEELVTVEQIGIARNQNLAVLHFAPVQYNPVTNQLVVCRSVDVTITYVNADQVATQNMQELHYSPAFAAASTMNTLPRKEAAYQGAPVRYLIVANSMFQGQLDELVTWKKRKGYRVDVAYTSDANVGTTTTSIKNYITSLYTNATAEDPAPTFVLLVGDIAQIPNHSSAVGGSLGNDHPTDLYYFTWTSGDNIPDCYYGRFSVTSASELSAAIAKTLTYEQYTFADPSFLNTAIMVAGVDQGRSNDNGYKFADPTHDYAITNYINGSSPYPFSSILYYKNQYSSYPSVSNLTVASNGTSLYNNSMESTIRTKYSEGAGWINYSAHGNITEWSCPEITVTQVNSELSNTGKFGVMIGNCCLSNKFSESVCFGESLLRKSNAGAVGYIGGSNSTYWYQDLYWAVGYRSSVDNSGTGVGMDMSYNASYPGAYDLMCHTHGEAQNTWHTSLGAMITAGNNTVETSGQETGYNFPLYYWEIYHLMGDPSITPWLTTPDDMTLTVASTITAGTTELSVTAVPYAYVAMTTGGSDYNFVAAAFADASGVATLTLPSDLAVGTYEVVASAQQYKTAFANVQVIVPAGPYVTANSLTEDNALNVGQSATYTLALENVGTETANNLTITFASNNDHVTVTNGTASLTSLNAGASQTLNGVFSVQADATCTDQMPVTLTATVSWTGCETPSVVRLNTVVNAPMPEVTYTWNPTQVAPGGSAVCNVTMTNNGHMAMDNVTMTFTEDFPLVEVTGGPNTFNLAIGGSVNYSFTATVNAQMPGNVTIPFTLAVANDTYSYNEEVRLLVTASGSGNGDNFDDGDVTDWTGGTYPWIVNTAQYVSPDYSMKSADNLNNRRTSEMSYTYSSDMADSIRFYYKVSSEDGYDIFHFYIDDVDQTLPAGNSGEVDWTRAAFAVSAGSHTYKFAYVKDQYAEGGSDCAWVDDVVFPSDATALQSARTDQVCQNAAYTINGETVNTSNEGTQYFVENLTASTGILVELNVVGTIESAPITIETCDSYEWNGTTYNNTDTYTYTTRSAAGCDSVATLNLTILPNYTITFNANGGNGTMAPQQVCSGQTVNLTANSFTNSGSRFRGWATSASGDVVYTDGAEITVTGNITLFAVWNIDCTDRTATVSATACDSYTWYGTPYTTSGVYTHTVQGVVEGGCDSIYTLNLTINLSNNSQETRTACDSYTWNGETYTSSGTYTYNGTTAQGCTDVQTLTLTIEQSGTSTLSETACDSYTWSVNGQTYTSGGTYTYNGTTAAGCNVNQTLNLTINRSTTSQTTHTACDNYVWNGVTYTVGGTYTISGTNDAGCTDEQTLVLTINQSTTSTNEAIACDSYSWNGNTYTTSGTYTVNGTNANGCPDVQTLNLTINNSSTSSINATSCNSYVWDANGQTYTTSGTYTYTGVNANGCQDVQTLVLTINQSTSSTETQQACDSYIWYGTEYTTSGTYTYTSTGANGCDNQITLYLTVGHNTSSTDVVETCDNYTWRDGNNYTSSTNLPTWTSTNAEGCIETVTLNLTIHSSAVMRINDEVTVGQPYGGYGFWEAPFETTGMQYDTMTLQTVYGCDSIVILNLAVMPASGIDDVEGVSVSLYPNPTSGNVNITLDGMDEATIELYDMYGRRTERIEHASSQTAVDMSNYATGVYFVRIYKGDTLLGTKKVVRR